MTQELVDWWNGWDDAASLRDTLGMRMVEADSEHIRFEVGATEFNKIWGYFAGFALLGVIEHVPGTLVAYDDAIEHVGTVSLDWLMSDVRASFLSNTTADSVICESRWVERGERQCSAEILVVSASCSRQVHIPSVSSQSGPNRQDGQRSFRRATSWRPRKRIEIHDLPGNLVGLIPPDHPK